MKRYEETKKRMYLDLKEKSKNGISNISKENSDIILRFIKDMEFGLNIGRGSKKGGRSYAHLYSLQKRMTLFAKNMEAFYEIKDLTKMDEREIHKFFDDMRKGVITRPDGGRYQDPGNYVKMVKSFWHWWMKVNRKTGVRLYDIAQDLDTSKDKPRWVYLTEEEIKRLQENAIYYYKVLIMFLFDTGVRAPSELINIRVSDFHNDFKEVEIRDEISKTFGRRIKLMISSDIMRDYVKNEGLEGQDYLFNRKPATMNQYLQRLAKRVLGEEESPAGQKYSELTMYDFRHCSCCYWLPRYKSESALKYRFGWKKSDKIHYYSELLGMRDTITEEDLLVDISKTEIEKQLIKSENNGEVLQERVEILEKQMQSLAELINKGKILLKDC